jgi:hypothetical protein
MHYIFSTLHFLPQALSIFTPHSVSSTWSIAWVFAEVSLAASFVVPSNIPVDFPAEYAAPAFKALVMLPLQRPLFGPTVGFRYQNSKCRI